MQKQSMLAMLLLALMVSAAVAAPRKLLASGETMELRDAAEHKRILAELEAVHHLRERMLADGATLEQLQPQSGCTSSSCVVCA